MAKVWLQLAGFREDQGKNFVIESKAGSNKLAKHCVDGWNQALFLG